MQTFKFLTEYLHLNTPIVRLLSNNLNFTRVIKTPMDLIGTMTISKTRKINGYFYLNTYSDRFISENIVNFNGFFIDFDLDWELDKIIDTFHPTAIVFSGRGYHLYYLFEIPIIEKQLIYKLGTDIRKWNKYLNQTYGIDTKNPLTAMPRLPGTINTKSGKIVEILYTDGKRYTETTIYDIIKTENIEIDEPISIKISNDVYGRIINQLDKLESLVEEQWVKDIMDKKNISKIVKPDGTPDISRIFFYFIKRAQEKNIPEIAIVKVLTEHKLLAKQLEKRGGLNKYSLEEIFRIMTMPIVKYNKPVLFTTFKNTTVQTLYDGKAEKEDFIQFFTQSKRSQVVKKDNLILGKINNYTTYENVKNKETERINSIEPLSSFSLLKITIDDILLSDSKTVNQSVDLQSKISALKNKNYIQYQYIIEQYRELLEETFNKPLVDIIPLIKPNFYNMPKHILTTLIKRKSSRIFYKEDNNESC